MSKISFCHYGRFTKDNYYRTYNLAYYSSKINNVTLITTNSKISFLTVNLRIHSNFNILITPSFFFPSILGKSGFGLVNTLIRTIYLLYLKSDIVYSDSNQRFTSGIPCYLSKVFRQSVYYAEWWDFYGKGGLFDQKKGLKKVLGYYEHLSEIPCKKSADHVVVLSSKMMERAIRLGISKEKLLLVSGGADIENIPHYPTAKFKVKYGFRQDSFVFGFSGVNHQEINDIRLFISVLYSLRSNYGYKNLEWFTTGDNITNLIAKENTIGTEYHHFNFLTYTEYSELLGSSDCLIALLEDNLENQARWPNKIGDYFAAGRPILTSSVGEISSLKRFNLPGLFFLNNSKQEITKTIIDLISSDNLILMGNNNRIFAEEFISWEKRSSLLPFNK